MFRSPFSASTSGSKRRWFPANAAVVFSTVIGLAAGPAGGSPASQAVWDGATLAKTPLVFPATERPATGLRALFYEGADFKGRPTRVFA